MSSVLPKARQQRQQQALERAGLILPEAPTVREEEVKAVRASAGRLQADRGAVVGAVVEAKPQLALCVRRARTKAKDAREALPDLAH